MGRLSDIAAGLTEILANTQAEIDSLEQDEYKGLSLKYLYGYKAGIKHALELLQQAAVSEDVK